MNSNQNKQKNRKHSNEMSLSSSIASLNLNSCQRLSLNIALIVAEIHIMVPSIASFVVRVNLRARIRISSVLIVHDNPNSARLHPLHLLARAGEVRIENEVVRRGEMNRNVHCHVIATAILDPRVCSILSIRDCVDDIVAIVGVFVVPDNLTLAEAQRAVALSTDTVVAPGPVSWGSCAKSRAVAEFRVLLEVAVKEL